MSDAECVAFLQWALPRLGLRWAGFRKVRRQVCRRITSRIRSLGLSGEAAYRQRLEADPEEWSHLANLCRVTISRFHRDRGVHERLVESVLPLLAREARRESRRSLRAWSAGCASGEEPYTLRIGYELAAWREAAAVRLRVLATDVDPVLLARARRACYPAASLRELPGPWVAEAFDPAGEDGERCLRARFRRGVHFARHDVRGPPPRGPFDLVLCRNLAFTYFDEAEQRAVLGRLLTVLRPGGCLVVGKTETLPETPGLSPVDAPSRIYRRAHASGRPMA